MPYAELRVREISINDIVPPRPVSIFQRRPKTRNVYCRLIVVRDPAPPHGRPADAPASPPISATPSPGDVELVPGAAPSSASSPPPPPTKMLEFKTPVVCGTLSPVFAMEDPRIAHEASLAQAITSPMDGEAAPPADADAASPGPPSEATGGGKRRSLDQQFGPPPPLFSVPLDLDDVMNGNLRVEIWDDALGDLVGTATFSIRQIFELEFGLDEFCQIGDVEPTAALLADEAKRRRSALCSWSWCHTTNADRPAPLPPTSPASIRRPALNVMMGADMDATTRSPQTDAFKYGCVRIFARAMSPTYIVDMLSSADVASVMAGFQVVLHIVQYSDPQDLMRNLKAGDDEITPPPALIRVLQRDVFEAMFAAPTRFRNDESTSALSRVSVYRQLSHKLWIVLDTGTARFGNAFAASLYHFGGQLAKLTDLDMMTPTICLSVLEMIARLDPGPRMDALSSDDGVAISNLIRLVDPDHPQAPLIAESIQVRAMQLLTTFAVQVDLPFSWRLSYARRLSAQSIDRILAYHLVEHADTDLAVDALDLCMALTTVVDEIVETYRGMSPLTTPGSSGSEPAAALKDVRTSILQRAKLARDDRPPPMTTISDSDEKNGDNLSPRHRGMDLERPALMPARRSITRQSSFPVLPVGRDKPATQTGGPASGTKDASSCELVSAVAVAAAQITTSSSPNQRKLIQKKQSAVLTRAASVTSETIAAAAPDSFRHRSWSILKGGDIRATDDETKQALRLMEQKAAAIGSENARLVQRILFTEDFGLERLRLSLNACRGAGPRPNLSSALFPLANMTEARLPQGRSCKGYDVNVHCEFVLGPERERFAVTHVIVAVGDQSRQLRTDVAAMALYLTEEPILHDLKPAGFGDLRAHALLQDEDKRGANSESQQPQHQQQHSHHHHHQQQQQQNVDRAPVFAIDLRPHRFVEIILPKEHTGRFLTLTLNPSSKAEGTGGFVSVDFVAFVGWPLGASAPPRASRRRPHLQLIGNVAYHVSINVPMDGGDLVQLEESRRHAARFRDAEHNNSGAGSAASSGAAAQ